MTNNDTAPPKRKLQPLRNQEFAPFTISRGDCEKDDAFIFSAQQMNLGSYPLEVWVSDGGSDCTQVANRISTAATCWRIETLGKIAGLVRTGTTGEFSFTTAEGKNTVRLEGAAGYLQ
ncbi:MAG: hypothetical protein HC837_15025, partial [Chloroflexaceae bacterium]|nr:hypothetical protein [Chloroflexaceae bacterium]